MPPEYVVMVVMRPLERARLVEQLEDLNVGRLALAGDCYRARQMLEAGIQPDVVLVALALPDGNWTTILDLAIEKRLRAAVVVCAEFVDTALRHEILGRADSLLLEPYRVHEVQRILRAGAARARLAPAGDRVRTTASAGH